MKILDIPKQNRPRERFLKLGPEVLSDAELFAILLRTGTKGENVIDMSNRLISEYGLNKLFDCSLKELLFIGLSISFVLLIVRFPLAQTNPLIFLQPH